MVAPYIAASKVYVDVQLVPVKPQPAEMLDSSSWKAMCSLLLSVTVTMFVRVRPYVQVAPESAVTVVVAVVVTW